MPDIDIIHLFYFGCVRVQAIKQKLQIHRNRSMTVDGERPSPQEEDKAKMLFGNRHAVRNEH